MTGKLFMMLLLSIALVSVNSLTFTQINYIRDCATNGTDLPIDLSSVNDDYIYFSFNSTSHAELNPTNRNTAIFSITEDCQIIKNDSVYFYFSEKNWDELEIKEIENVSWEETKIEYEEEIQNKRYFYKIERTNEKYKTLLLRVATNNVQKGELTVINEDKIPSRSNSFGGNIRISNLICLFILILNLL